jgi:thiamine-monophosphate kinase
VHQSLGDLVSRFATVTLVEVSELPTSEHALLALLTARFGGAPAGLIWAGDDAALIGGLSRPLLSTDLIVEGVHVDRRWCSFADMGHKAVSVNVSDIAAMGGTPRAVLVAVAGATTSQILEIMDGVEEACTGYGCDVVGGDLTDGATLVISVCAIGEDEYPPIVRSGAKVGDLVFCTQEVGGSAAGLRLLRADPYADDPLAMRHRRPQARVVEGRLLGSLGAHAMLDCSDGFAQTLLLVAQASRVGVVVDSVPVVDGATFEEAFFGGEDYELVFSVSPELDIEHTFVARGLAVPILVGRVVDGPPQVIYDGTPVVARGYEHRLGG